MRRKVLVIAVLGALAAAAAPAQAGNGGSDLARVRAATAGFHRIEVVEQAGYKLGYIAPFLLAHCIAHPTDGAMGFHYFNHDMIHDTELNPLQPEGIVYAPGPDGRLQLAAVEWIVPVDAWHDAGNTEPPTVLGNQMHVLNRALGWYILHAWVWKHNPSGMFQDWNPNVSCD